jgi:hypothetical protein
MASPYLTVLEIVNEVCDRMNIRRVTTTTQNMFTKNTINLLNDIMEELADLGTWNELQASAAVTMVCGQSIYTVDTTALVTAKQFIHSIQEVSVSGRVPPLEPISDKNEFRMLNRVNSIGQPSRYIIEGVDSIGNPRIGVFPRPGANYAGNSAFVKFQVLPPKYVAGTDDSVVVPFPGRVVVLGLVAAAILDESAGAETRQYQAAQMKYLASRNSSLGRQTAKTGEYVRVQPGITSRS